MPAGRPSKYKPEFCEEIEELGKAGLSLTQMAARLDVDKATLTNWSGAHPEFLTALTRAQTFSQAWWEDKGMANLNEPTFQTANWKKSVESRFRDDYTERKQLDVTMNHEDALAELE